LTGFYRGKLASPSKRYAGQGDEPVDMHDQTNDDRETRGSPIDFFPALQAADGPGSSGFSGAGLCLSGAPPFSSLSVGFPASLILT